jgi:hypothetical protein
MQARHGRSGKNTWREMEPTFDIVRSVPGGPLCGAQAVGANVSFSPGRAADGRHRGYLGHRLFATHARHSRTSGIGRLNQAIFWVRNRRIAVSVVAQRLSFAVCHEHGRDSSSRKCSRCGQAQMLSWGQAGDKVRRLINLLVVVRPLKRGDHVNTQKTLANCTLRPAMPDFCGCVEVSSYPLADSLE